MENIDERNAMTEDTWRPWEQRRFQVDKKILEVETNQNVGDEYSVDFLEPNYALTPDAEIMLWDWRFQRGLATPLDWYDYYNPDSSDIDRQQFQERQESVVQENAPQNRLLNILTNNANNRSGS